jgi:hypothetical protein
MLLGEGCTYLDSVHVVVEVVLAPELLVDLAEELRLQGPTFVVTAVLVHQLFQI